MKMNTIVKNILIAGVIFACGFTAFGADDAGYALLLQSSPVEGGSIMPGQGVHKVQIGNKIQLTAVPQPGFRFLYWVGDVGQIGSSETSIQMDSPKLVVAVFSRESFDDLKTVGIIGGPANGGTYASAPSYGASRGYGTAIGYPDYPVIPQTPPDDNGTLVPDDPKVPEPATLLLFASGAIVLARRQRTQS